MKIIALLILTLLVFNGNKNHITIKLDYQSTSYKQVLSKGFDELTVKAEGKVILKVLTNQNGVVKIEKEILNKYGEIDIFLTTIGIAELYLITINNTLDELEVKIPRDYKLRFNRAICPKCNKVDIVYKAIYGDNQMVSMQISDRGDTTYSNIVGRKYYMGTCITNDLNPQWYCDRDKIQY